jgi:hypothetical protein
VFQDAESENSLTLELADHIVTSDYNLRFVRSLGIDKLDSRETVSIQLSEQRYDSKRASARIPPDQHSYSDEYIYVRPV